MNVLVTGGAGYIGSHVVQSLISQQHQVIVLDDFSTGNLVSVPSGVVVVKCNVLNTSHLIDVLRSNRIDVIFHMAAKLIVAESELDPISYYDTNVAGMISVLKAAELTGVTKFIFSSTAAVYGESKDRHLVNENDDCHPVSVYGRSKYFAEAILKDFSKAMSGQFSYVILRYFNVAGASKDQSIGQINDNATHLIKIAAEAAVGKRDRVNIFGTKYSTKDGSGVRDYIHVVDLANAHLKAFEFLRENTGFKGVFNCGYGRGFSVFDVIDAMQKVSSCKINVEICENRPGDLPSLVANSSKIKSVLGWRPAHDSLEEICRDTFLWEKKNMLLGS